MSVLSEINPELWEYVGNQLKITGLRKAAREFLTNEDVGNLKTLDKVNPDYIISEAGLFNEWLLSEYRKPGSQKSLLRAFADQAKGLSNSTRRRLDQFLDSQRYTLWRVGEVEPGNLELIDLKRGSSFRVREYSLAKQVVSGDCIFLRIARQDDHWEIVSADGAVPINLPDAALAEELAEELNEPVSIKESFSYVNLIKSLVPEAYGSLAETDMPLDKARQNFDAMLKECRIGRYVTRENIEKLMKKELADNGLPPEGMPIATRLLIGLADNPGEQEIDHLDKVTSASSNLWNALRPRKYKRAKGPGHFQLHKTDLRPWQEALEDAHVAIKTNDPDRAVKAWQEFFRQMLDGKTTSRSLYRHYANAAVAYLVDGDMLVGERLLSIALELCPDYDFALEQQTRVNDGEYMPYVLLKTQEALASSKKDWPPSPAELRSLSDDELIDRFSRQDIDIDKSMFIKLAGDTKNIDELLSKKWRVDVADNRGDHLHFLALEANRRWAPEYPWPETLEQICFDIDSALHPDDPAARRSYKQAARYLKELESAVKNASKKSIASWMAMGGSYAGARQNVTFACLDLKNNRSDAGDSLETTLKLLHEKTKDPMFLIPDILLKAEDSRLLRSNINKIAKQLPLDDTVLGILAEQLPDSFLTAKEQALLLALRAIEKRQSKGMITYPPYNPDSLQDSYGWILDQLCDVYEKTGETDKLDVYQERYMKVMEDESLSRTSELTPEETKKRRNKLIDEHIAADNPAILYYEWFKTLGIDLSSGDGMPTAHTVFGINNSGNKVKIGRNDPCPCGKTKPDGTPVKFKKCHGASG